MASTASVPIEQSQAKLSFAKVAASAYKPTNMKETPVIANVPVVPSQPTIHLPSFHLASPSEGDAPKVRIEGIEDKDTEEKEKEIAGNKATRTGQWANTTGQQVAFQQGSKEEVPDKPRPAITLARSPAAEDSSTQLSSSDGSAKPPSLDGKSIASATTFALDEKESIRPDDSASLRAVEEEDVTSPPDSVAADSRVGSDSGIARAFSDQLHEIAVIGPLPRRGAPPGRFPSANAHNPHNLYDPNQPPNGVNGMQTIAGPQTVAAVADDKLIEALESPRDRLFVLKIEQDFIDFIKDSRENELSLPNFNTFYRMLAHKLADYYLLGHVVDTTLTGVRISRTSYCRIPPPLSSIPVNSKNANTPPADLPARKIMRRGDDKSGTNTTSNSANPSKTTSEAGGANGSDGGSDEADGKDKSALTREEREARYREARQRIFGNSENGESESTDAIGSGEEKDASRSSSASGKKKNKKHRNYDDDGFEARSRFNAYYPQQYAVPSYAGDNNAVYFGGYPGPMPTPQYPGMNANSSPPPTYNNGYPPMMSQDAQPQYGWPAQQYPVPSASMGYPNYPPIQNGYDLSADFQRGMQSFQSAGVPSQVTPKMANPPMASYQEAYPQPMSMNPGWPQMNQQPTYPMVQPPYAQNGTGNRPMSAPSQGPVPGSYAYGQFPATPYNGKSNRNQHPLPGSFNRQQFNPQSQAFIPGGRNAPFQMQPHMPSGATQGMNGYSSYQMQTVNQMPRLSPPVAYTQSFGTSQSMQGNNPVPTKPTHPAFSPNPQIASSQLAPAPQGSIQTNTSSVPAQSSIAKWGTPSHLPPRPPPPAQPQPPKFNLPGNNLVSIPRVSNNPTPGFGANPPVLLRGGADVSMPNRNSS